MMLLNAAVLHSRVMYNEMELKAANLSLKNYYSFTKNLGFHRFQTGSMVWRYTV